MLRAKSRTIEIDMPKPLSSKQPVVMEPGTDIFTGKPGAKPKDKPYTGLTGPKIRCPLCRWKPKAKDKWSCSCGFQWHTFETGGVCPGCMTQHTATQCLKCDGWSAHSAWYNY